MGADESDRRLGGGGGALTARRALVVPAVPSFSVDGGFRYGVAAGMDGLAIGSLVRVPLGGRRVRGFVIDLDDGPVEDLKPIAAQSGARPVFDVGLLETLRWAALHYVSPLSTMLERAAPPNNPQRIRSAAVDFAVKVPGFDEIVEAGASSRRTPPIVVLAPRPPIEKIAGTAARLLEAGRSTLVVTATVHEAESLFDELGTVLPGAAVVAHGDMADRSITGAWNRAQSPVVLVGTPRIAAWQVARVGAGFVIEEGRRAMKDRQTPTLHVRELLRARAQRERFPLVVVGPTPTTEILALGPRMIRSVNGRLWGHVEVIDRRVESSGSGVLTDPVRRALAAVSRRGGRTFVFGHRRGYAAASRCVACKSLRRCPGCGSRPDPGEVCIRCGASLGGCTECGRTRFEPLGAGVGRLVAEVSRIADSVEAAPSDAAVVVGTERDVLDVPMMDLVVVPDMDGLLGGTNYRAAEDALRLTARLAGLATGSGRRMMIQTSDPDHPVVRSLVRGDPIEALRSELDERQRFGYPPAGELIVVEITGGDAKEIDSLDGATVLGPAPYREGQRWLIQGADLRAAKLAMRPLVQRWRDGGARVRIDVDPIDL